MMDITNFELFNKNFSFDKTLVKYIDFRRGFSIKKCIIFRYYTEYFWACESNKFFFETAGKVVGNALKKLIDLLVDDLRNSGHYYITSDEIMRVYTSRKMPAQGYMFAFKLIVEQADYQRDILKDPKTLQHLLMMLSVDMNDIFRVAAECAGIDYINEVRIEKALEEFNDYRVDSFKKNKNTLLTALMYNPLQHHIYDELFKFARTEKDKKTILELLYESGEIEELLCDFILDQCINGANLQELTNIYMAAGDYKDFDVAQKIIYNPKFVLAGLAYLYQAIKNENNIQAINFYIECCSKGFCDDFLLHAFINHNDLSISSAARKLYLKKVFIDKYNVKEILPLMEREAENGDGDIAFKVSEIYKNGLLCEKNIEKSIKYCKIAADNKNQQACKILGDCYRTGNNVDLDLNKAAYYYGQCESKCDSEALSLIAEYAEKEENWPKAIRIYSQLADRGDEKALYALAELSFKHNLKPDTYTVVRGYYSKVLLRDPENVAAKVKLRYLNAVSYLEKEEGKASKNSEKDTEEALENLQFAANQGLKEAIEALDKYNERKQELNQIKEAYVIGKEQFIKGNYEDAVLNFKKSMDTVKEAKYMLALCYDQGLGIERNYNKAYELLLKLELEGLPEAELLLGKYYENGLVVPKSLNLAVDYYKKALEKGCYNAAFYLAEIYYNNLSLGASLETIVKLYKKAPNDLAEGKLAYIEGKIYNNNRSDILNGELNLDWLSIKNDRDALMKLIRAVELGIIEAYEILADSYVYNYKALEVKSNDYLNWAYEFYNRALESKKFSSLSNIQAKMKEIQEMLQNNIAYN